MARFRPALVAAVALSVVATVADVGSRAASEPLTVPGLERPVRVLVDEWGVPHIYADRVDGAKRQRLTVGAWPLGGSAFTPMATGYRAADYQLTAGASFRMVVDVGNWDASVAINTPGQSGDPASPHYRDLAPLWAGGRYFPLVYSREAVERRVRTRLDLVPRQ